MPEMNRSSLLLSALLTLGLVFGCTKQSVQAVYDKQETNISSFVEAQVKKDSTATVTYKNGTVRLTLHDTLGREGLRADSLSAGGIVSFYYAGYVLKGSNVSRDQLFATNHKATADAAGWNISDTTAFQIETLPLDDSLLPGLYNGLEGVRNQDECFILFSGKYAYGSHTQGTIPARSALVYHIWVSSISND
ncbi:MAG: FKBP-type peptidyl-prolyl cis-trans isomerase [Bacteroidales bacterium]|nr:FKBP-type peptidyl-prolyl cis-trans isomerase [Bacteroidales bacterium]